MKIIRLLFAFLFGLSLHFSASSQTTNVLFLGNSYTASNQLPILVKQLALSAGDNIYVESLTIGGYTLGMPGSGHLHNPGSIELIQQGNWDFVVLQEQSQMPTIPYYRDNYTFPASDSLNQIIQENNQCASTVFFMTWGRKYGGEQCINSYCSPIFVDYAHMQDSLESAYMHMALSNDAICAPVGISWSNSIGNGDPIELFSTDGSHPSLAGSYLAACTFYATFFQKSPLGIEFVAGLNQADAIYLQQLAEFTVLTDPLLWNIHPLEPLTVSFTYELDETLASFTNISANTSFYKWDFGDPLSGIQNTSSLENPDHEYSAPGSYLVSLVAGNACQQDTAFETLVILDTGIESYADPEVKVFPNPVREVLYLEMEKNHPFLTYDLAGLQGCVYLSGELQSLHGKARIEGLLGLSPGVYILILKGEGIQIEKKIIITP